MLFMLLYVILMLFYALLHFFLKMTGCLEIEKVLNSPWILINYFLFLNVFFSLNYYFLNMLATWGLFVWSIHVHPVLAYVFSPSIVQGMEIRPSFYLPMCVKVSVNGCQCCNLKTCSWCIQPLLPSQPIMDTWYR